LPIRKGQLNIKQTDAQPTRKRTSKTERGFAPPGMEVYPDDTGLVEDIYRAVREKAAEEDQRRKQSKVYASGIKNCARQIVFSIWGLEKQETPLVEANPQWKITAERGERDHQLIIEDYLRRTGCLLDAEFRVSVADGAMAGRVDALIVRNGERMVLDLKTAGKEDYEDGPWGRKFEGYIQQLTVYGYQLGVKWGIILMENRDNSELKAYKFPIRPETAEELYARAQQIMEWADNKVVPPAETRNHPVKSKRFGCNFCPFVRQCEAEEQFEYVTGAIKRGEDLTTL